MIKSDKKTERRTKCGRSDIHPYYLLLTYAIPPMFWL